MKPSDVPAVPATAAPPVTGGAAAAAGLVALLAANRLVLAALGLVAMDIFRPLIAKPAAHVHAVRPWLSMWGAWDTGYYLSIARDGYAATLGPQSNIGWFPLYPLLVRAAGWLVPDLFLAAVLVSNLFLLAALWGLYQLIAMRHDAATAGRAVKYLVLFPSSMVLSGAFTESVSLFLLVACLLGAQRNRWLPACAALALLLITRPTAAVVPPVLLFEYLRQRGFRRRRLDRQAAAFLLVPLPLLAFLLYLGLHTGDLLAYLHQKAAYDRTGFTDPAFRLAWEIYRGLRHHAFEHGFNALLTAGALAVTALNARRLGATWTALSLLLILFPLSTGAWTLSFSRYVLLAAPVFAAMALSARRPTLDAILTAALAALQAFAMIGWVTGLRFVV